MSSDFLAGLSPIPCLKVLCSHDAGSSWPACGVALQGEEQADGQAEDEDAQAMLPKGDSAEGSQADAGQAGPSGSAAAGRRGSKSETTASDVIAKHKRAREAEKKAAWFDLKVNTSVYITGLPEDATEAEVAEVCVAGCSVAYELPLMYDVHVGIGTTMCTLSMPAYFSRLRA